MRKLIHCVIWVIAQTLLSLVAQMVKNLPAIQETRIWSLGWEDPLEKRKAMQYSIPGKFLDYIVHGIAKSQTQLSDWALRHAHPPSTKSPLHPVSAQLGPGQGPHLLPHLVRKSSSSLLWVSFWEVSGSWNKERLRASASCLGRTLTTSDLVPPPTHLLGMRFLGPQIGHFLVAPTGILDTSGLVEGGGPMTLP